MRLFPVFACAMAMAMAVGTARSEETAAAKALTGKDAFGDWRGSAPGVRRLIMPNDLPPPFETKSERNSAELVERPDGAAPLLPKGFTAALVADGLAGPRTIRVAPNGDAFVAESDGGRIRVFRLGEDGEVVEDSVFADGFDYPYGIAFYPPGPEPTHIYVADTRRVVRLSYRSGDLKAGGPAETVIADIPAGGHATRDIAFSPGGETLYLATGSATNVADDLPELSAEEVARFEAGHGVGAAWDRETDRAAVIAYDADGKNKRPFATGIRNCSGLAMQGAAVWCSTNERDGLGDDLPPDYVSRIVEGGFYGWPWYYTGGNEDPRHAGARPDLRDKVIVPDVLIQPHSAPLGLTFYDGKTFPAEYRGEGFAALHGSWNRGQRTGYKVVRIVMRDGQPTGAYEDFMTGFVTPEGDVWGRPVGVAVGADGSLFVSEDGNGTLWRVTWRDPETETQ